VRDQADQAGVRFLSPPEVSHGGVQGTVSTNDHKLPSPAPVQNGIHVGLRGADRHLDVSAAGLELADDGLHCFRLGTAGGIVQEHKHKVTVRS
jgi:hypothetical protein